MPFIANTAEQQQEMLSEIGCYMADLFGDIPESMRCKSFDLPSGMTEEYANAWNGLSARASGVGN